MQKENEIIEDIKHWQERVKGLELLKSKQDFEHPDFDQTCRDLNNAQWKVEQLLDRKNRPVSKISDIYSLPKSH